MSSENMRLVKLTQPPQPLPLQLDNRLIFQHDALRISHAGDPGPKTSGFINDQDFRTPPDFRSSVCGGERSEGDEGEEEDDEEDNGDDEDEDDGDCEVQALVGVDGVDSAKRNSNNHACEEVAVGAIGTVESNKRVIPKECNNLQSRNDNCNASTIQGDDFPQGRVEEFQNAVTVANPGDMYYLQYSQGMEGSCAAQKGIAIDNGCGFSGRKESSCSSESGVSLRMILSDPITGTLMDDAVILPCGHSFGSGGIQHVLRMKCCYTCSHPASHESISPNLSLRAAVQAFRREEELQVNRSAKRRRERFEQNKGSYGDPMPTNHPTGRGFGFPFAVTDRVIIKGNKRTPQRFVGREAIVTTQCLNGWYVVKTLDNAESVKLQYRSLAKVPDHNPSPKPMLI